MDDLSLMMWSNLGPELGSFAPSTEDYARFSSLFENGYEVFRACFLKHVHAAVVSSGLHNPYEPLIGTIEVPHPYTPQHALEQMSKLEPKSQKARDLQQAGLTVHSPRLFYSAVTTDILSDISGQSLRDDEDVLCDADYGIVIFSEDARPDGFCLISTPQVRMNKNSLLNQN